MNVLVIAPPAPVVALELAKAHLRVESGDQDVLIQAYIDAGTGQLDGPGGWLGRAIGVQTLEAQLDSFPPYHRHRERQHGAARPWSTIALPYPPLRQVVSIKYDDPDQVEQTLDPADYRLTAEGVTRIGRADWPATYAAPGSVRIRYTAGYDAAPAAIVLGILLMVGDAFENSGTTDVGRVAAIPMSVAVDQLLSAYRVWFSEHL